MLCVAESSVREHVSPSDPHGVLETGEEGSHLARLEAGDFRPHEGRCLESPVRTAHSVLSRVPQEASVDCQSGPPPGCSLFLLRPLTSHSGRGQVPSTFLAPSPASPRPSGGLLITSSGSLSDSCLQEPPTPSRHLLVTAQNQSAYLCIYCPKKLSCAFECKELVCFVHCAGLSSQGECLAYYGLNRLFAGECTALGNFLFKG